MNKAYVKDYEIALQYAKGDAFHLPWGAMLTNHGVDSKHTIDLTPHMIFADYLQEMGLDHFAHIIRLTSDVSNPEFKNNRFIHLVHNYGEPSEIGEGEIRTQSLFNPYSPEHPLNNYLTLSASIAHSPRQEKKYVIRGTPDQILKVANEVGKTHPINAERIQNVVQAHIHDVNNPEIVED